MNLKNKYEFIEIFKVKGTVIRFHWLTFLLLVLIFITSLTRWEFPFSVFALLIILLAHELGHKWFASMLNRKSSNIDIYPIGGVCYHEGVETEYEDAFIAWGGVVVQAMIFVPALILYYTIGDIIPHYLKTFLYYLGFTNLIIAAINLIPIAPLDGEKCWRLIPLYFKYGGIKIPQKNSSNYQKKFDKYLKKRK